MLLLLSCPRKNLEELGVQVAGLVIELFDVVRFRLVSGEGQDNGIEEPFGGLMELKGSIVVPSRSIACWDWPRNSHALGNQCSKSSRANF